MNRNLCCQQSFSFVLVWHCHPWRHCLPSVSQHDDQQSRALALKRDSVLIQSMIGYWQTFCALSFPKGCGMPNVPGDSCRARVIHSPLMTLWGLERWSLNCALMSQLHIFFKVMKDLFMLWSLSFAVDNCVWLMYGIVRLKLRDHDAGSHVRACMYEISLLAMPRKSEKSVWQCVVCTLINDAVKRERLAA